MTSSGSYIMLRIYCSIGPRSTFFICWAGLLYSTIRGHNLPPGRTIIPNVSYVPCTSVPLPLKGVIINFFYILKCSFIFEIFTWGENPRKIYVRHLSLDICPTHVGQTLEILFYSLPSPWDVWPTYVRHESDICPRKYVRHISFFGFHLWCNS